MKRIFLTLLFLSALDLRAQTIPVPNGSFESPATSFASPNMDAWVKFPQSLFWDPSFGDWTNNAGEFANVPPGQPGYLANCDGAQAAYLVSFPGVGVYQVLDATYQPGRSYTATVALTSSSYEPLTNGATIQLGFFYLDAATNMTAAATTEVTYDTNVFTNSAYFVDFTASLAEVRTNDPWAGHHLGLWLVSDVSFAKSGGVWDADNVRLTEGPSLSSPALTNGQFTVTLLSYAGLKFNLLATSDLSSPASHWTTVATITNTSGTTNLIVPASGASQQFYTVKQIP